MTLVLVLQFCNQETDCSSHFITTLSTLMAVCLISNGLSKDNDVFIAEVFTDVELHVESPCASLDPGSSGEFIMQEANITAFPQMEEVVAVTAKHAHMP